MNKPTIIGKLTVSELAKLHEPAPAPMTHTLTAAELPSQVHGVTDLRDPRAVAMAEAVVRGNVTGVMVLIDVGGGIAYFATDFEQWGEPLAPTVREAQAFRATREACKRYMVANGGNIGRTMSDEERESVVMRLQAGGHLSIHVLDVPKKAFE